MKNYLSLSLIILFLAVGCSKTTNPFESLGEGSLKITGIISNYDGDFKKVYFSLPPRSGVLSYFESEITPDGAFDITIAQPADVQLIKYISRSSTSVNNSDTTFYIDSLHIADDALKYSKYSLSAEHPRSFNNRITYSLPLVLGERVNSIGLPAVGDYVLTYYYFTTQTKIQGYRKWKIVSSTRTGEIISNFNINTKVGWNLIMTKVLSDENSKTTYEVTDVDTESGVWMIGSTLLNSFLSL